MKNNSLKNSSEDGLEIIKDMKQSRVFSLHKIKFRIADSLESDKKEKQINFNSKKSSKKNSKNASNGSSPTDSLRKLKTELINEKLNKVRKNKLDKSFDNDSLTRNYNVDPIQETKKEDTLFHNDYKEEYEIEHQNYFTLSAVDCTLIEKQDIPLESKKLSQVNQKFINFLQNKYNIEIYSKTNIPLISVFEIYDEFITKDLERKGDSIKNSEEIKNLSEKLKNFELEQKILKENLKYNDEEIKNIVENTQKAISEHKISKKILMNMEKDNLMLKTELLNAVRSKNLLVQKMKKEILENKELINNLVDNVKIYD